MFGFVLTPRRFSRGWGGGRKVKQNLSLEAILRLQQVAAGCHWTVCPAQTLTGTRPASHQVSLAVSHHSTAVVTSHGPTLEVPSLGHRAQNTKETPITECGVVNEAPCNATFSLPFWVAHKVSLVSGSPVFSTRHVEN